ncbi:MAG: hypothetical protein RL011_334 [Pseudomonadota bacterium]|jgi:hypothetical protein
MRTWECVGRLAKCLVITSFYTISMDACSPPPLEVDRRLAVGAAQQSEDAGSCLKLVDSVPGYEVKIQGLVSKYCISCHDERKQPPYLANYEQVKKAAVASKAAIYAGSMPVKPQIMADVDKALFSAWVDAQMPAKDGEPVTTSGAGAPGAPAPTTQPTNAAVNKIKNIVDCNKSTGPNTPTPGPNPAPGQLPAPGPTPGQSTNTPSAVVTYAAVIAPYLEAKCNSCHRPGGAPPVLTDYATAKAGAARSLVRMKAQTMPLTGGNTAKEIGDFELWIQGGMPQ